MFCCSDWSISSLIANSWKSGNLVDVVVFFFVFFFFVLFFQTIAWWLQASSHYLHHCSKTTYDVSIGQWINSLVPGRCGTYFKSINLKLVVAACRCETAFGWMPESYEREVNIGTGNGLPLSRNKALSGPILTQFSIAIGSWEEWPIFRRRHFLHSFTWDKTFVFYLQLGWNVIDAAFVIVNYLNNRQKL